MNGETGNLNESAPEAGRINSLIREFNVLRRNVTSYPSNHPQIHSAAERVLGLLEQTCAQKGKLSIAVVKDRIKVDDRYMDSGNPAVTDFARFLFSRGVASVVIPGDVPKEQILLFNEILNTDPEVVVDSGGIESLAKKGGLTGIRLTGLDYSLLVSTEETVIRGAGQGARPEELWEYFVLGLLEGSLRPDGKRVRSAVRIKREVLSRIIGRDVGALTDDAGDKEDAEETRPEGSETHKLDPELLARVLNSLPPEIAGGEGLKTRLNIEEYIRRLDEGDFSSENRYRAVENLSRLIDGLKPELKKQFLSGAIAGLKGREDLAEGVLAGFSKELVLEALNEVSRENEFTPPRILEILSKLSGLSPRDDEEGDAAGPEVVEDDPEGDHMKNLLKEEQPGDYMPEAYSNALSGILSEPESLLPDSKASALGDSLQRMEPLEPHTGKIILEAMALNPPDEEMEILRKSLLDLAGYFLETGDFSSLLTIHDAMAGDGTAGETGAFDKPEFMGAILDGLDAWGKDKYPDIRKLIQKVGEPFIDPLLDRLAVEDSMSARRLLIDCLSDIGRPVVPAVVERLNDDRWYFIRNLIMILRNVGASGASGYIRAHISHSHPKVRLEAMKALLAFGDDEVESALLKELDSQDPSERFNAVQVASHSRSLAVMEKLVGILRKTFVLQYNMELRKAAIISLADIANPEVLPDIIRVLKSRSLLHSGQHSRMKLELLKSLARYPAEKTVPFLRTIVRHGNKALTERARKLISSLTRGQGSEEGTKQA